MLQMFFNQLMLLSIVQVIVGCVGPTTPFGAIATLLPANHPRQPPRHAISFQNNKVEKRNIHLTIKPERQVLHDRAPFSVAIADEMGFDDRPPVHVFYNGIDVRDSFLRIANKRLNAEGTQLVYQFPPLRLHPGKDHDIWVAYGDQKKHRKPVFKQLKAPLCPVFSDWRVATTERFDIQPSLFAMIENVAKEEQINPAFLFGLIAQESSFNPRAVSWAKAMGLTQMTYLAAMEVADDFPRWPIDLKTSRRSFRWLKKNVKQGTLNASNDWRLNPVQSVRGGARYIKHLVDYWRLPSQIKSANRVFVEPENEFSNLLLASYNSGAARVSFQLRKRGKEWLMGRKLKEARRYVGRVNSFCYHFSH